MKNKFLTIKFLTNYQLDYNCLRKFLIDKSSNLQKLQKHVYIKLKSGLPNYKVAQKIITKMRSLKITKLRNIITKLRRNYKVAQNNYKVAQELQSCAKITKLRRTKGNTQK